MPAEDIRHPEKQPIVFERSLSIGFQTDEVKKLENRVYSEVSLFP